MQLGKIIVVDNNSHIESKKVLDEYTSKYSNRIIIIRNETNVGSAIGFGQGMQAAIEQKAEFIWLLDDDLLPEDTALSEIFSCLDKILQNNATEKIMLLSNRINKQNIYLKAIIQKNQNIIIGRKNSFRSLHIFNVINDLSNKFFHKNTIDNTMVNNTNNTQYEPLGAACYGGLFFNVNVIEAIGFPNKNYILYYDDYEYSLRHIKSGGKIFFVTRSIVHDQITSWHDSKYKFAFIEIATHNNFSILYYSIRNSIYFAKTYNIDNKFIFYLNLMVYSLFTCLTALILLRLTNIKVYAQAVKDGIMGRMGLNQKYTLK